MYTLVVMITIVATGAMHGPYEHSKKFDTEYDCIAAIHSDIGSLIEYARHEFPNQDFKVDAKCELAI